MSKCEEVKTVTETRKLNDTKKKRRVKATNQDTEPVPTTNQKTKTLNKIRGCETAFLTINTIGVPQMYHWTANCSITVNRRFGVSLQPSTQEVDVQAAGRSGRVRRVFSRTLRDSGLFVECQSERDSGQGCARAHIHVLFAKASDGSEVCFVPRRVVHALQHSPHHLLQVLARSLLLLQRPFHLLVVLPGRSNLCTTVLFLGGWGCGV